MFVLGGNGFLFIREPVFAENSTKAYIREQCPKFDLKITLNSLNNSLTINNFSAESTTPNCKHTNFPCYINSLPGIIKAQKELSAKLLQV